MHETMGGKAVVKRDRSAEEIDHVKKPTLSRPSMARKSPPTGPLAWLIDAWDDRDFGLIVSDFVDPDIF